MLIKLSEIRQFNTKSSLGVKIIHLFVVIFLGLIAGFLAKYLDLLPQKAWNPVLIQFFSGLSGIGSMFSIWAFTTTLVAVYSRNPLFAGIHSFIYLFSMNIAYYIYQIELYGVSYQRQFVFWSIIACFSLFFGAILWYAKGNGLLAAFLTAIPISVVLCEAALVLPEVCRLISKGIFYNLISYIIVFVFCIAEIIILLFLLQKGIKQKLYVIAFSGFLGIVVFVLYRIFVYMRMFIY
jgi:hypothetical protein